MLEGITIAWREDGKKDVIIPVVGLQYDVPSKTWYARTMESKYGVNFQSEGCILAKGAGSTLESALDEACRDHMTQRKQRGW